MTGSPGQTGAAHQGAEAGKGAETGTGTNTEPGGELLGRCHFPPPGTAITCAVSGGADSLALLVLGVAAGCTVTAIHVDHGLRPGSGAEAEVVASAAERFGAGFRSVSVTVDHGPNLEARARDARRSALPPGTATGHTMDDQAETVLVNMLRGAGLDGLAGMRAGAIHPILGVRRAETRALCQTLGLDPVEDPSNADPAFVRNRIRQELVPLCCSVAGRDVVPVLARQASLLADEADLLEDLANSVDAGDVGALQAAPGAIARRATRRWLRDGAPHPPDLAAVERVLAVARGQLRATDVAPGVRVRRSRGVLSSAPVGPRGVR